MRQWGVRLRIAQYSHTRKAGQPHIRAVRIRCVSPVRVSGKPRPEPMSLLRPRPQSVDCAVAPVGRRSCAVLVAGRGGREESVAALCHSLAISASVLPPWTARSTVLLCDRTHNASWDGGYGEIRRKAAAACHRNVTGNHLAVTALTRRCGITVSWKVCGATGGSGNEPKR